MEEQIKLFLNSDLDEADYFSLSKENLLTLRELLLQFKEIDNEFTSAIQEQFQSIKEKCNWLSSISFGGLVHENGTYEMTAIYLYSEDGIDIIASYNNKNNRYEGLAKNVPKIYLLSGRIRKHLSRQNEIEYIQDELLKVEEVGRDIYRDILVPVYSVSSNFRIHYTPHFGLSVYNKYDLIANYYDCSKGHKEKEILEDEEVKEKLLTRILVKPNIE